MSSFLRKVNQTILRHELLACGDRILIGVSGGPDSMALLHALGEFRKDWKISLIVCYLDHGLRPEAAEEKSFVAKAAADLGVPFLPGKADVRALKREKRLSLQEAAREARYDFFQETARECRADRIALGHTADDQAELVLMRLLRGAGGRGLAGIPPQRGRLFIRPLIEVWRKDVESFLREKGIPFREDSSNRSLQFLRNRIRHELLPLLENFNPRIRQILVQMADRFRLEEAYWQILVQEKFPAVLRSQKEGTLELDIPALNEYPLAMRLHFFRQAVQQILGHLRRFSASHFIAMENLCQNSEPNKEIRLPCGVQANKRYQVLKISLSREETLDFEKTIPGPGTIEIPEIGRQMRISVHRREGEVAFSDPFVALLDGENIHFPLTIRSLRPGDRFRPLGMDGEKKVKDFFIDHKIPLHQRRRIPLLFSQDQLLWIAGLRINHRFRLTAQTCQVLKAELL